MADSVATASWQRHDLPGRETCQLLQHDNGWQLSGLAVLTYEAGPCQLEYRIDCDRHWVTQLAVVTGWVGSRLIGMEVVRNANGNWSFNGTAASAVDGCIDIDLNFSPSTNLLPIRRTRLAIGEQAVVLAAWLRFPGFELEPLEQSYTRLEERRYRYESGKGRFAADVTVDADGLVLDYGDMWSRVG